MRRAALSLMLVLAGAAAALAQAPVGPAFKVTASTTVGQFLAAPLVGHDGGVTVVWTSGDEDWTGTFGQRFSPDGVRLGDDFRVNTYTTGYQGAGRTVTLADGGWLATFANIDSGAPDAVWARRYSAGGVARGPDFQVSAQVVFGPLSTAAADPRGGFIVFWEGSDGDLRGVFGRRYDRASEPVGAEFQVNTYTLGVQGDMAAAVSPSGAFTVVWTSGALNDQDGDHAGVFGQRFDADGQRLGGEFQVNSFTTSNQYLPDVAINRLGQAIVIWTSKEQDGSINGVYGRRYGADGALLGAEFRVNEITINNQRDTSVDADENGNFVVSWRQDYDAIKARRYDAQGVPRGGEFIVAQGGGERVEAPQVTSDRRGNFIVAWQQGPLSQPADIYARRYGWLFPGQLRVDPAPTATSDGNHIFEPCERGPVQPGWRNRWEGPIGLTGTATSFTGPPGATYTLHDAQASYGPMPVGGLGPCPANGNCYEVEVSCPSTRPATHWDAVLSEDIAPVVHGQSANWRVHIGDSFTDVPRASPYYLWVEALLHNSVTGGCSGTQYCGSAATTREQMAVFLVAGRAGPYYAPVACQGTPVFPDVPVGSPYCRWIEELSRLGVTAGCGGGNYCPTANVSRQEMAVFVLRTAEPGINPPACTTPVFADVPASSPYCRWIEELARRGVITGCGGGNFCPNDPVTREQMAVFIVLTYGLGLYEP